MSNAGYTPLKRGDVIRRGDVFENDSKDGYHHMDPLGRLFGIVCLKQIIKKSNGGWYRPNNTIDGRSYQEDFVGNVIANHSQTDLLFSKVKIVPRDAPQEPLVDGEVLLRLPDHCANAVWEVNRARITNPHTNATYAVATLKTHG